jgi:hypothetical protein
MCYNNNKVRVLSCLVMYMQVKNKNNTLVS